MLFVEPMNEEFKLISAMFKWKFCAQKNILFVFAENDFQDFVLVFNNEIKCKKVYDLIHQKRENDAITNGELYQGILSPMLNQIIENKLSNAVISELLLKWIYALNGQNKEEYIQMMKDANIYSIIFPNGENVRENHMNDETNIQRQRKRKFSKIEASGNCDGESLCSDKRTCRNGIPEGTLVIFDSKDKSMIYEYFYSTSHEIFVCSNCGKKNRHITAKIHVDEKNGEKFIELSKNEHICEPKKDEFPARIINHSNFMIVDRENETNPAKAIVFTSKEKELCYELHYFSSRNLFECFECKKLKKCVSVKLYTKENGEKYLLKLKNDHICEPKKYEKAKIVPKSMFELYQNRKGAANKKLVVFSSEKKDLIYEYSSNANSYRCLECTRLNKYVAAKLMGEFDEKYLELSKTEHICKPKKYNPKNFKK
uniref:Uncharacterized protein n=1 Tax=Panagrolaimus davidi TaxID=227884 RepID=A0A914PQF3_9BILA